MILSRSLRNPNGQARRLGSVRLLSALTLGAYPAGALLRLVGPDTAMVQIGGLLFILLSLAAFGLLVKTRLSRITGEHLPQLDEYERNLRAGAMETAYHILSALIMLGFIYFTVAADFGWWLPRNREQWNALVWCAFLCAAVLPTAVLSFRTSEDEGAAL